MWYGLGNNKSPQKEGSLTTDAKTRYKLYYTGVPTFAVFTVVLMFIESYITVAHQRLSDSDNSS